MKAEAEAVSCLVFEGRWEVGVVELCDPMG